MKKGVNIAIGAITGAAIGVVAGILTAPKSGKETRGDLKSKATKATDRIQDSTRKLKKKFEKVSGNFIHNTEASIEDNDASNK